MMVRRRKALEARVDELEDEVSRLNAALAREMLANLELRQLLAGAAGKEPIH